MPWPARFRASRAGHARVVARQQHVLARAGLLALGDGRAAVFEEVAQQALAIAGRGVGGRDSGVEVMHDTLAVSQRRVVIAA